MITCGIDPGIRGGVAFIDEEDPVLAVPLPKLVRIIDVVELCAILNSMAPRIVYIEQQVIMQGQKGALSLGANYGRVLAAVEMCRLPHRIVTPVQWKAKAGFIPKLTPAEKKEAAFEICRRTFGGDIMAQLNLTVPRDGPNEALLLAHYGPMCKT